MDTAFELLRWIVAILLGGFGALVIVGQGLELLTQLFIKRSGSSSIFPFVGGISGALAMLALPIDGVWKWAFIPLLADVTILFLPLVALMLLYGKIMGKGNALPAVEKKAKANDTPNS